ncbi:collagen-like triple helix repeat-containing protein [Nostoc sp.]
MVNDCAQLSQELAALKVEVSRQHGIGLDDVKNFIISTVGSVIGSRLNPAVNNAVDGRVSGLSDLLAGRVKSEVNAAKLGIIREVESDLNAAMQRALATTLEEVKGDIRSLRREVASVRAIAEQANSLSNTAVNKAAGVENRLSNVASDAELAKGLSNQAKNEASSATKVASGANSTATKAASDIANVATDAELAKGLSVQARREVSAVSAVANAARTEARDVRGIASVAKGVAESANRGVQAFGAQVNRLGNLIEKVEGVAVGAAQKAANAVGISNKALGQIGSFAGRLANLAAIVFSILGTIAQLVSTIAAFELLGRRIDGIENAVLRLGGEVSVILGDLVALKNRVNVVNGVAVNATYLARQALGIANDAASIGRDALGSASTAGVIAVGAAKEAQSASTSAAAAKQQASNAYQKAQESQGIGEQAKRIAGEALNKAGVALGTALTAIALYQGIKSLRGLQGIPGIPGRQGERGAPGRDGVNANTIVINVPGQQGAPGVPGRDGTNGRNGINGRDGQDVNPADLAALQALIVQQHQETRANVNATTTGLIGGLQAFASARFAGITSLMTSIAQNTYVEKALQILTFATTLHNALMLTNNLGQTLGSIINTVLGLVLPKGIDGTPLDINSILGKATTSLIQEAIGEDNYTKLSQEWALANRIYQASANVFNAITNATSVLVNGLEVIGSHVAKIGNALKYWGVLGQKAYEWFHPNPNFHNKYFTFLNNAETAANTIQAVVQVPVSIVDAKNQIDSANAEFQSAIKGDKNPDGSSKESGISTEENKNKKDEVDLGKTNSQPFTFDFSDLFDGED